MYKRADELRDALGIASWDPRLTFPARAEHNPILVGLNAATGASMSMSELHEQVVEEFFGAALGKLDEEPSEPSRARGSKRKAPRLAQDHVAGVLVLEVSLRGIQPRIWRRIEISSDLTLADLHEAIQTAMGWTNSHLHMFIAPDGRSFGSPTEYDDLKMVNEKKVRIGAPLQDKGDKLEYEYDFGDGWGHTIKVRKVQVAIDPEAPPRCVAGARACPPEDCGGVWGYARILDLLERSKSGASAEAGRRPGVSGAGAGAVDEVENRTLDATRSAEVDRSEEPNMASGAGAKRPEDADNDLDGDDDESDELVDDFDDSEDDAEMLEWVGEYKPEAFDLEAVNAALRSAFPTRVKRQRGKPGAAGR